MESALALFKWSIDMRSVLILLVASALSLACNAQISVAEFGPLRLGARGPVQPGDPTAHPHRITPRSKFYVLVVAKGIPTMCTFEDCGKEAAIVEGLGGWITGDDQLETIASVGLDEDEVKAGSQSLVVISNRLGRIVGIYPRHSMRDLLSILKAHRYLPQAQRE